MFVLCSGHISRREHAQNQIWCFGYGYSECQEKSGFSRRKLDWKQKDSTAAADLYTAQAGNNENGFSNIDLDPANGATPTFLVCTTMSIILNGRRNVELNINYLLV